MTTNNETAAAPDESTPAVESTGDAELVARTRDGDAAAYGELWRRHYRSGITVARSITSAFDADDLVQEAYAKIYQTIMRGCGPTGSFRAYLFTSVRNAAASWGRSRREWNLDELETVADPDSTDEAADEALDQSLTTRAFRSLPTRWQEVLWYSEVEQLKPAEIAPLLGMTAGSVSQLAFRAREGLREAWIQAHLRAVGPDSECQWSVERLGAHSRGNLGARDKKKLEAHLNECSRCLIVASEAKHVSERLALVLLPLLLGAVGASGYLAALQSGATATVPLAAMPSAAMPGAVIVGSVGGAAGGTSTGSGAAGAGSSAGGTGAGGAASTTGLVTGMGALVGAGSVALVVAGAIVAAAVVPGLVANPSETSAPVAGEMGTTGIVTEVSPTEDAPAAKPLVLQPIAAPQVPRTQPPPLSRPAPGDVPTGDNEHVAVPTPVPTPEPIPTPEPTPPPGTEEPDPEVPPVGPTDPGEGESTDPSEPGDGGSDGGDLGGELPGPGEPGIDDPGPGDGNGDGSTDPSDPGDGDGGTDPSTPLPPIAVLPEGTPTIGEITSTCYIWGLVARYSVAVSGEPGSTVQAFINGTAENTISAQLDEFGNGTVELRPSWWNRRENHEVQFHYVLGDKRGTPTQSIKIKDLTLDDDKCWNGSNTAEFVVPAPSDEFPPVAPAPEAPPASTPATQPAETPLPADSEEASARTSEEAVPVAP